MDMKCFLSQAVAKALLVLDVERINEALWGFSLKIIDIR